MTYTIQFLINFSVLIEFVDIDYKINKKKLCGNKSVEHTSIYLALNIDKLFYML